MFFLIWIISVFPIHARSSDNGVVVLPFKATGSVPDGFYSLKDLPVLIQESVHFIFSITRDYPLSDLQTTNRILKSINYQWEKPLDSSTASRICIDTGAGRLLTGSVHFYDKNDISLSGVVYSCRLNRVEATHKTAGKINNLQSILKETVHKIAVFAPEKVKNKKESKNETGVDVFAVVDMSGSMLKDRSRIDAALSASMNRLPDKSRLGIILLKHNGQNDILPLSEEWRNQLVQFRLTNMEGEVDVPLLNLALDEISRFRDWKNRNKKVILFSDVRSHGNRLLETERKLRSITSRGVDVSFYQLYSMNDEDREEWKRIARSMDLPDPTVTYARKIYLLQGFYQYIVQIGGRFYRSGEEIKHLVLTGNIRKFAETSVSRNLIPLETIQFDRRQLNLDGLPDAYARLNGWTVTGSDPVFSDLDFRVSEYLGVSSGAKYHRVLLKNESQSFWISVKTDKDAERFKSLIGQKIYTGLRFQSGGGEERIVNLPDTIYIRKQGEVPRLMINNYPNLLHLPPSLVNPSDIWFLLSEVKDVIHAEENRDIRE